MIPASAMSSRRKCIHGTDHIPLDARDLDKTADRVTHETEQVL